MNTKQLIIIGIFIGVSGSALGDGFGDESIDHLTTNEQTPGDESIEHLVSNEQAQAAHEKSRLGRVIASQSGTMIIKSRRSG